MSKSQSTQQSSGATPAWPVPRGYYVTAWSVRGRGKSATYCALMPHGMGEPGQRVAMVAKSGAVTLATLTNIRDMGDASDAGNRWDFNRETLTPEQQRANRAAKSQSTATYWASDAGLQTAERIAERRAAMRSEPSKPSKPASEQQSEQQSEPDDIATTVAMLIAGGMSPSDAAAVGVAMRAAQSPAASPEPASKPRAASKPRQSTQSPAASPASDVAERCDACNRDRKGCADHVGAPELLVCPRCASLDADTARVRAARHGN